MRGPSRFDVLIFLIWCAVVGGIILFVVERAK